MSLSTTPAILADTSTVESKRVTHRYRRRFVLRTIRHGRIKIYDRIFEPDTKWLEYDGRLDGMRYAFGLYWTGNELESFVALWGSEKAYRAVSEHNECCKVTDPLPPEIVYDKEAQIWYYPWATWYAESM